ncbi:MAG: N-acetylmuramic acid 6-phosphate etherase, partial [Acidobacteriota bacterium]|nr:N-acetylmuramic acid 6-phosphate etherase [Acidobacteriota bacterium]
TWRRLPTEARHAESTDLDRLDAESIVSLLIREDRHGLEITEQSRERIALAAQWFAETLEANGSVLFAGAGTSGRLGVLEAAECPPTFGTDPDRIRAAMAGGPEAVFRSIEGAEDRGDEGRRCAADLGPGDLLIGLSASSVTPFVLGALEEAREKGARTVLLTCAGPSAFAERAADLVIALDTGPEILTGSTRLKAGSATKAALNAITTTGMVLVGKVYSNWMVDLEPKSSKLRDRAIRIVESAAGVSASEAERLHRQAGREVKTAIVMARLGVSPDEARERLAAAGGRVRQALAG